MSKIIIFSTGVVKERLIGPEIRVWEFAKNLFNKGHDVTLAVPNNDFPSGLPFNISQYTDDNFNNLTKDKDVAVVQGDVYKKFIRFAERIPTVCDLYDPYIIECLHLDPGSFPAAVQTLKEQLLNGDFFLCSSESQRLFYLGMLAILGRLDPAQFSKFNKFENLIDLVPFGAAEENLDFTKAANTGKYVNVFLGGVYTWYDPFTSLDCLKIMLRKRNDIKFLFIKFPYNITAIKNIEKEVLEYAVQIGVKDNVIFNDWVPYEERSKLYSDIDVALVIHRATLEASLSFRTRVLDLLSFGIPVITNEGGDLEKLIKDYECGLIVKENDSQALADALLLLIENQQKREEMISRGKALIKEKFLWEKVIEPLDEFCKNPSSHIITNSCIINSKKESLINKSINTWRTQGFKCLIKKSITYLFRNGRRNLG